jgi:diguanylate cyclase (GGDEF)-like protein
VLVRLAARHDVALLTGLAVAVAVAFSEQLSRVVSTLRQLDALRDAHLVPALAVLLVAIVIAVVWRSHDTRRESLMSATSVDESDGLTVELAVFASLGGALANAQDIDAIRTVAADHLPDLLPRHTLWMVTRGRSKRDELVRAADGMPAASLAPGLLGAEAAPQDQPFPDVSFPMLVGGTAVGTLGVSSTPSLTDDEHRAVSAAASLLALAVRNAELRREVRENSVRDALTGCFTRAHALEVLEVELRRARRTQMPLSILRMDLDNFASLTERHGDPGGDAVLTAVGQRLKASLRGSDVKCRYGAEAFLVILPDTPMNGALRVSETLSREVERDVELWDGSQVPVSASFGVATIRTGEVDPTAALARANDALERAKQQRQGHEAEAEYVAVPA